jgi:hypothetical protein
MTTPSKPQVSTPALYVSNWVDLTGIWRARQLDQVDDSPAMPGICELHYLGDAAAKDLPVYATNQIVGYTGFFRDESAGIKYTRPGVLDADAWFESDPPTAGTLTTNYVGFGPVADPRVQISRCYVAVPDEPFIVCRYTLVNPTVESITFNVLDLLQPHGGPANAWYDQVRNALFVDRSASGQPFLVLGAFQPMDSHQVGDQSASDPSAPTCAALSSFEVAGTLNNNDKLSASDLAVSFQKKLTLAAGGTETLWFYVSVRGDLALTEAAADAARARTGSAWFDATAQAYGAWFANSGRGLRLDSDDDALNRTFDCSLIVIKNCQNPGLGTFPASTNPLAYGYKNWARDASITAICLDASGHPEEAARYWTWMAGVQNAAGTWATTYNFWDGSYMQFVEPEYDSIGAFLYGVCRHYEATRDEDFLATVQTAIDRAASWVLTNIAPNGFGAADFSIWEEPERGLEHNAFTQAWYVAGLYAVQRLYEAQGKTASSDLYAGGPASILTALQRPLDWGPPGLWNHQGYYIRAVNSNGSVQDTLHDSSSNVLFALGALDVESQRSVNHVNSLIALLTHEQYGIGRYEGDDYYDVNPYDPALDEAHGTVAMWPQMSNWIAVYETLTGQSALARARLQWYTQVTGKGYTPPGEAVSYVTRTAIASSMSEPLTAGSFVLASLVHLGKCDTRIAPPVFNAGTFKTIAVSQGTARDWGQWQNVAYFLGGGDSRAASPVTDIKRVYACNDATNLYLRIDNRAGSLPPAAEQPAFALRVYAGDFAGDAPRTTTGLAGQALSREVSFAVERRGTAEAISRSVASTQGQWTADASFSAPVSPQWDPASGRIEAVIPITALSTNAEIALGGSWSPLIIVLTRHDQSNDRWLDDGRLVLHYRLSSPNQDWIYGNIEQ